MEPSQDPPAEIALPPAPRKAKLNRTVPWYVAIPLLLLVVGVLGGGVYFATLPKNGVTAEGIESEAKAAIKPGTSTRDDVMKWAASRGYEAFDTRDPGGQKNGLSMAIPNDTWLKKQQVMIQVRYDRSGTVTEVHVHQGVRQEG
jgi:hypothetical protein